MVPQDVLRRVSEMQELLKGTLFAPLKQGEIPILRLVDVSSFRAGNACVPSSPPHRATQSIVTRHAYHRLSQFYELNAWATLPQMSAFTERLLEAGVDVPKMLEYFYEHKLLDPRVTIAGCGVLSKNLETAELASGTVVVLGGLNGTGFPKEVRTFWPFASP